MEKGRGRIVAIERETDDAPIVHVEFFGLARQRAGVAGCEVRACRLADVLIHVERLFPLFAGHLIGVVGEASPFRVSLDGKRFLAADEVLAHGARVLILSGDAGG